MLNRRLFRDKLPAWLLAGGLLSGAAAQAGTVPHASAPGGRTDTAVREMLTGRISSPPVCVIVRTTAATTSEQEAQMASLGAGIYRRLPLVQSVALRVPERNLARLMALPFVSHVSADMAVRKTDEFTVRSSGAGTAAAHYGVTGKGVCVAVIDSGVKALYDLADPSQSLLGLNVLPPTRVVASVNFVPGTKSTDDTCGHGTHIAGIIAGNGSSSTGLNSYRTFYGIAPGAQIASVRVLNGAGQSDVSTVIAGIQWAVANKTAYKIRIINLSLGHSVGESYTTDPLCQAVEAAWKAGIVVVCAAGNNGRLNAGVTAGMSNEGYGTNYGSINSPGNDPYVITVGATKAMDTNRAHDKIATYSSRGPSRLDLILKPDIIAPGNKIISALASGSTLATEYSGTNLIPWSAYSRVSLGGNSNQYFCLSGTSMATPVVAGAAALMLQKYPTLTPDTIKARLMLSADKWVDPNGNGDALTYGVGYLNIPAAMASSVIAKQMALSPRLTVSSTGSVLIDASHAVWGNSGLWGTGVTDLHAVWGNTAISGDNTLSASHAVWGNCTVWSDHAVWGNTTDSVDLTSTALLGD